MESEELPDMTPLNYDDWSRLICQHFFTTDNAQRIVFFAVDARSLSDMSGLAETEAVDSLVSVVRNRITDEWHVRRVTTLTRMWENYDAIKESHPAIPFLALTVLAATRMGESRKLAAHNYYVPLRRLLNPADTQTGAPGDYSENIEYLWESVRRWLREGNEGKRGLLPERPDSHYRYIIEALQFAIVRASYFRKLDEFFRRIGLEPGEEVSGRDLVLHLKLFLASRREEWARRLLYFCEEYEDIAISMVSAEARKWDGLPRDARTGKAIGRLRFGFDSLRRLNLHLLAEWDERLPESVEVEMGGCGRVDLSHAPNLGAKRGWYQPCPLPVDVNWPDVLEGGLEIKGREVSFDFQEADVYVLAYDDGVSGWRSVSTISLEVLHCVLVRDSSRDELLRFLKLVSAVEPKHIINPVEGWPSGWSLISNVRIDVRPLSAVPELMGALIPSGAGPRLRLQDGLRVGGIQNSFLTGGEPRLVLNSLAMGEPLLVQEIDPMNQDALLRHHEVPTDDVDSGEVLLWNIGFAFTEGVYRLVHGTSSIRVQFVDSLTETGGEGMSSVTTRLSADTSASGTILQPFEPGPEPRMVRAPKDQGGASVVLLLGSGSDECHIIRLPTLRHLQNLSWIEIDAWCGFEPQWAVDCSCDWAITPLKALPDEPREGPVTTVEWKTALRRGDVESLSDDSLRKRWGEYRRQAGINEA